MLHACEHARLIRNGLPWILLSWSEDSCRFSTARHMDGPAMSLENSQAVCHGPAVVNAPSSMVDMSDSGLPYRATAKQGRNVWARGSWAKRSTAGPAHQTWPRFSDKASGQQRARERWAAGGAGVPMRALCRCVRSCAGRPSEGTCLVEALGARAAAVKAEQTVSGRRALVMELRHRRSSTVTQRERPLPLHSPLVPMRAATLCSCPRRPLEKSPPSCCLLCIPCPRSPLVLEPPAAGWMPFPLRHLQLLPLLPLVPPLSPTADSSTPATRLHPR